MRQKEKGFTGKSQWIELGGTANKQPCPKAGGNEGQPFIYRQGRMIERVDNLLLYSVKIALNGYIFEALRFEIHPHLIYFKWKM